MKFTLNDFYKCADSKRISAHYNTDRTLVGFKYTPETVYSLKWDDVSLCSRGITFDTQTGEIIAFPFKKFFNFEELYDSQTMQTTELFDKIPKEYHCSDIAGKFRVMEKYDGSLGIAFNYKDKWFVKTSGSFDSEQAVWATKYLNENCRTDLMNKDYTYCFEIIYNEDVHPIHYDFEGLVLLGIIDKRTGIELPLSDILKYDGIFRTAKVYEFSDFRNVYNFAKKRGSNAEGVVVTFEDGWKTKIKGDKFLELQKFFHNVNKEEIWKRFNWLTKKYDDFDFILNIPEELKTLKDYAEELPKMFDEKEYEMVIKSMKVKDRFPELWCRVKVKLVGEDRKKVWEYINNEITSDKTEAGIIIKIIEDDMNFRKLIWMLLKPKGEKNV